MRRGYGSRGDGGSFDPAMKLAVWWKGRVIPGVDPAKRRVDNCGSVMDWDQHGVTVAGGTGWEIDHIRPVAAGGGDGIDNLQPLQWQNNRAKGDDWPNWRCAS